MCWKKLFGGGGTTPPPEFTKNTVVCNVVGNYPGSSNDLAGPPYDLKDFEKKILTHWPHYTFRKFLDSQATKDRFLSELKEGVKIIEAGDLLLFINDNCFSATNTKKIRTFKLSRTRSVKANNYIAMSASLASETAADAEFDHPNGAYTYCLIHTLEPGITYLQWHERTKALLKKLGFRQTCVIEGPAGLLNRIVFDGNVITYYISSHGTNVPDKDGDELDGFDEGPYFFDGFVLDDTINAIIATNPALV